MKSVIEADAMRIASREHGPQLVDAPARGKGGQMPAEIKTQTAELQARIEHQIREMLAAGRDMLEASRLSEARSQWLAASGKGSGTIQ